MMTAIPANFKPSALDLLHDIEGQIYDAQRLAGQIEAIVKGDCELTTNEARETLLGLTDKLQNKLHALNRTKDYAIGAIKNPSIADALESAGVHVQRFMGGR